MFRLVAWVLGLLAVGCTGYVLLTYTLAFAGRDRVGPGVWRAAVLELLTTLLLLPLWPLWLIVGASYEAVHEGEGEARGRRHPVVLLHGYGMNQTSWVWVGRRLARRGIGPLYAITYFSPQRVSRSARQLRDFVERVLAREDAPRVDIVAHSLGGVVARHYIECMGGGQRVGRLVTIASPHKGTRLARFGLFGAARDMVEGSDFLCALGRPPEGVAYTSIWSRADAVVMPPESSSIAPHGQDRVFDDLGHLSLLLSPRVADVVAERLQA